MSNDSEDNSADTEETHEEQDVSEEVAESEETAADEEAPEGDEETAEDEEGLQNGEVIRIEYTARTVEEDRLVDTTSEEVAKEEGVEEEIDFGPRTIVLGEGHTFPSVEQDIIGSEAGDTGNVVVSAHEAFGAYDDEKVRTISKDKIPEDDRYPGAQIAIDGEEGFVETIIGGRARVDFNHPLAGDDIEYDWEIVETVDDREERAKGLLDMFLGIDLDVWFQTDTVEEQQLVEDDDEDEAEDEEAEDDEAEDDDSPTYETVEVEKESLYIEGTPALTMNQQWMMGKQRIGEQLIDLLDVDRIVIEEVIEASQGMGMPGMGGISGMTDDIEAALDAADIDAEELSDE